MLVKIEAENADLPSKPAGDSASVNIIGQWQIEQPPRNAAFRRGVSLQRASAACRACCAQGDRA
jgi:hypothetical protein